jgi:hypothetical protein
MAGATLALHHHKRTLHAAQLIFLGLRFLPTHLRNSLTRDIQLDAHHVCYGRIVFLFSLGGS